MRRCLGRGGLGTLNALDGNYELTVLGGGIQDYGANPAANSASIRWALGLSAPVVVSVGEVLPDPRNTPVSTVDVVFSKPINPLTFDYRDLALSRDGGANLVMPPLLSQIGGATIDRRRCQRAPCSSGLTNFHEPRDLLLEQSPNSPPPARSSPIPRPRSVQLEVGGPALG